MTLEDEKPGPALEDRFRERFAQGRHEFRRAVSNYDSEWTVPTDPVGIITPLKTTPPPPQTSTSEVLPQHSSSLHIRVLLFVLIALLVLAALNLILPISCP